MQIEESYFPILIPPHWERTTLGAVAKRCRGVIQTGPFGSQLHASDYTEVGIPSIMPVNLIDWKVREGGIKRVSQNDAYRLSRHRVKTGDVIYSRRGDVERHGFIGREQHGWLCGTGCLLVRVGCKNILPKYVSHWLRHPDVCSWITRHAVGTTMATSCISNARQAGQRQQAQND